MIDDTEQAIRLANAIIMDIKLYNEQELARGEDLSQPLEEGRELFQSRVSAPLHTIYEEKVEQLLASAPRGATEPELPGARSALPKGLFEDERPSVRPSSPLLWLSPLLLVLGAALWFFVAQR